MYGGVCVEGNALKCVWRACVWRILLGGREGEKEGGESLRTLLSSTPKTSRYFVHTCYRHTPKKKKSTFSRHTPP